KRCRGSKKPAGNWVLIRKGPCIWPGSVMERRGYVISPAVLRHRGPPGPGGGARGGRATPWRKPGRGRDSAARAPDAREKRSESSRVHLRNRAVKFLRLKLREKGCFCWVFCVLKCGGAGRLRLGKLSDSAHFRTLNGRKRTRNFVRKR